MEKITKREFTKLHNNKLLLIGTFKTNKEVILEKIKPVYSDNKLHTIKTSYVDIDNIKDYSKTKVFKDNQFILAETNITDKMYGNSIHTICYLIK